MGESCQALAVLTDNALFASTSRVAGRNRPCSAPPVSYVVSDLRLASHRLDMKLTQRDGHTARVVIALPSSGEPQFWVYAPPVDADDWVKQLLTWIDEEVFTLGLVSGRVRTDHDGVSYLEVVPYGWSVDDPVEHERLLAAAGPDGWSG